MREAINHAVFGWYPYLCLTVFLLGSLVRFDREQYTWRSGSSQLLRRRQLTWGSNLFHVGILVIFLVFPFTRLVHVWSAPVWYIGRRGYQIVRSSRGRNGFAGARPQIYPAE